MTNKPMLSVERELLELVTDNKHIDKESISIRRWEALCKLRAILSKPAAPTQGEPAAKAKPVAKLHAERMNGRDGEYGVTVEDSEWFNTCRLTGGIFNLYAEQPAPVADQAQCEECKGWGYHENHHEGGGTECGECDGSGNASVAVVMPERMYSDSLPSWAEEQRLVRGWNACIEEVARLNGLKT